MDGIYHWDDYFPLNENSLQLYFGQQTNIVSFDVEARDNEENDDHW